MLLLAGESTNCTFTSYKPLGKKKVILPKSFGVPFIDLDSILPKNTDYFIDYIHWSAKGHEVVAKALYDYILKGNYISE